MRRTRMGINPSNIHFQTVRGSLQSQLADGIRVTLPPSLRPPFFMLDEAAALPREGQSLAPASKPSLGVCSFCAQTNQISNAAVFPRDTHRNRHGCCAPLGPKSLQLAWIATSR